MKLDLLAFAAHPDDVELSCSGTMYLHKLKGYKTGIVDLTGGELGTRGSEEIRAKEATDSSKVLQLDVRLNLDLEDGFFENNKESILRIVYVLRKYQPEIVLCNAPSDRHPDHGRASKLVLRACFLSGLIKINTDQDAWRPKNVYHYIQDNYLKPDFVVDISDVIAYRTEAIKCFKSQFWDENSLEPTTPISSKEFLEFVHARCVEMGRQIGVNYGEGFIKSRYLGVKNLFDLI